MTTFRANALRLSLRIGVLAGLIAGGVFLTRYLSHERTNSGAPDKSEQPAPKRTVVIIDAGHGGQDTGTSGFGLQEKDGTLDLARRVEKQLRGKGFDVRMTRTVDVYVGLEERAATAKKAGASVFVSIHLNASPAKKISGVETYFCSKAQSNTGEIRRRLAVPASIKFEDRRGELLASAIQQQASTSTGAKNRGAKDSRYFVVMHAACPAALIECGYVTNEADARKLKSASYKDRLAAGIADGISDFLKNTKEDPRRGLVFEETPSVIATAKP